MKKRLLIAITLVIALVLIAQSGVWAGRLQSGAAAPVAAPAEAGARPQGTVIVTEEGGTVCNGTLIVGSIAEISSPGCLTAELYEDELPADVPEGMVLIPGTPLILSVESGDTLSTPAEVCYNAGPDDPSLHGMYWDGTNWIEYPEAQNEDGDSQGQDGDSQGQDGDSQGEDNLVCISVSELAPNPTFAILCE